MNIKVNGNRFWAWFEKGSAIEDRRLVGRLLLLKWGSLGVKMSRKVVHFGLSCKIWFSQWGSGSKISVGSCAKPY